MNDNINKNENQHNDANEHELKFDNKFSVSRRTKDPLLVVTVSLRGGRKQRVNIISVLTCLWDSEATYNMIKKKHTKHYY